MNTNDKTIRQIAVYGKGGIGKSTVCANLSVCLSGLGEKVFQVGCSPKSDSTYLLTGDASAKSILGNVKKYGRSQKAVLESIVMAKEGIFCAETGGPEPAKGCAGKGVNMALEMLKRFDIARQLEATFVIYDVIGDVVCGGFAQPMRSGFAREIYIVTSGELMSLYSANNICAAIVDSAKRGADVKVAGLIANLRGVEEEETVIREFGKMTGIPVLSLIPRDDIVQKWEGRGMTVTEGAPESAMAKIYGTTSRAILENTRRVIPVPLRLEDLTEMLKKYQGDEHIRLKVPA